MTDHPIILRRWCLELDTTGKLHVRGDVLLHAAYVAFEQGDDTRLRQYLDHYGPPTQGHAVCAECGGRGKVLDAPGHVLDGHAYWAPCPVCVGET